MTQARFRFHGTLERFLAPAHRGRATWVECAAVVSAKHQIEALGVPHTEVGLLLVNGEPAELTRRLGEGDEVVVHPAPASGPIRNQPPGRPRFVADAHLGALARRLRMAGFDTLYDNAYADPALADLARREERILLTRDRELLKRRQVVYGCYVHALRPEAQLHELYERLALRTWAAPFSRCLACNSPLQAVTLEEVAERLPPRVRERHLRFLNCPLCDKLFWEGSHWRAMRERLALV
ncbi:Mut7-C RNAse domain-containing protein [uncultured Pseudomonas sp.]|uniref:Mut7-C RNAse domain-containing protein n=1 Tax=uncultured Pseudomonas sp. TaxID=114707 RepID=UPI0025DA97B7|nr:Mut7-C RNAse domain-containing protein [uncultured Pseudomonas sp.]